MKPLQLARAGLLAALLTPALPALAEAPAPLAAAETAFLEALDAIGAVAYIESGAVRSFQGRDLEAWRPLAAGRRSALTTSLAGIDAAKLGPEDAAALAAMKHTVAELDADGTTDGVRAQACADASKRDLGYDALRAALVSCYVELGNTMQFEGAVVDRGSALQLLHVMDGEERRKALFYRFVPLWTALNGHNEPDSPYRRLIVLAAEDAVKRGSEIDHAAQALGVKVTDIESWLVAILEAWAEASGPEMVEPWNYRYGNSIANRELAARIPTGALLPANQRYYRDIGADLGRLGVIFDLGPRPDKSPLAYTDFVSRGREARSGWQRPVARVVANYPTGGLYSLNELVHENGHAVHVSAIRTRPAYMDWPDSLFTEAFADVTSWSVHEPAWQRKYLGAAVPEAVSLRALFSDVMLDVAWSLFELRMLRNPGADPNAAWTEITSRYLHIVPHPELPWWAVRVQLVGNPGYMVNYGLGAVLTAEMRARTKAAIGDFDAGNAAWYAWTSERLLRFGSERDTRTLMQSLLGRPISPDALLTQIRRCR